MGSSQERTNPLMSVLLSSLFKLICAVPMRVLGHWRRLRTRRRRILPIVIFQQQRSIYQPTQVLSLGVCLNFIIPSYCIQSLQQSLSTHQPPPPAPAPSPSWCATITKSACIGCLGDTDIVGVMYAFEPLQSIQPDQGG